PTERRTARRVRPQQKRDEKKANKTIQRTVRAPGNRAPQRNVSPRPKPRQQRCQPSLQHHQQARTTTPRKPQKLTMQPTTKPQLDAATPIAQNPRTPPVKRQR